MNYESFRKEYESLAKKHGLVAFEVVDKQFEVHFSDFERIQPHAILIIVRRRIADKLAGMINMVQSILLPNTGSVVGAEESKFFSDEEKEAANTLMRELTFWYRRSQALDFMLRDEDEVLFLKDFMKEWEPLRKEALKIAEKVRDGWKITERKESYQYFG